MNARVRRRAFTPAERERLLVLLDALFEQPENEVNAQALALQLGLVLTRTRLVGKLVPTVHLCSRSGVVLASAGFREGKIELVVDRPGEADHFRIDFPDGTIRHGKVEFTNANLCVGSPVVLSVENLK